MRLLFVSHSLPPAGRPLENVGGIQRVAIELLDALRAHPEVELVPLVLESAWRDRHWRVPLFLAHALREVPRLVRRGEVDAVLFASMVTGALAVPLRRTLVRHGVPVAVIAYGHDVTMAFPPYQWWVPRVFAAADRVLPISRATADAARARGLPDDRCVVVPLGVDFRRFPPPGDRAAHRRALRAALGDPARPLPDGALLLCAVGRQVERKGFRWFVDAVMPRLPDDVHLWLAGDGPEHGRIRAAVAAHGLAGRVRLLGRRTDEEIALLYRGADLFVMPNIHVPGDMEGFGLVMLEAGANGLPTIAARLEGIADVVTDGENGVLVESEDAEQFAAAILRFHRDRELLARASASAERHTRATFGWRRAADGYLAAIRGITRRDASRPVVPSLEEGSAGAGKMW